MADGPPKHTANIVAGISIVYLGHVEDSHDSCRSEISELKKMSRN
jgi:hypothetical protein